MRAKLLSLLLLLLLACSGYAASPDGTVEVLQMPSWVERDGKRRAARVGMTLRDGDQVRTGRSARVVLRKLSQIILLCREFYDLVRR